MTLIVKVEKLIGHPWKPQPTNHLLVPVLQHDFVFVVFAPHKVHTENVAIECVLSQLFEVLRARSRRQVNRAI